MVELVSADDSKRSPTSLDSHVTRHADARRLDAQWWRDTVVCGCDGRCDASGCRYLVPLSSRVPRIVVVEAELCGFATLFSRPQLQLTRR